jgi:hypothetical protein
MQIPAFLLGDFSAIGHRRMHEFPPASELAHLVGSELAQVRLDPYGIQFVFHDESSIVAENAVEQIEPDGTIWHYKCVAAEAPPTMLHRLVGKTIAGIRSKGLRLNLDFNNGARLVVLSELGQYESGHIAGRGRFTVF